MSEVFAKPWVAWWSGGVQTANQLTAWSYLLNDIQLQLFFFPQFIITKHFISCTYYVSKTSHFSNLSQVPYLYLGKNLSLSQIHLSKQLWESFQGTFYLLLLFFFKLLRKAVPDCGIKTFMTCLKEINCGRSHILLPSELKFIYYETKFNLALASAVPATPVRSYV